MKLIRILAALAFLGCGQAQAAVLLDACSLHSAGASGTSNSNHTVGPALTNGILTVVAIVTSNNTITPTTVIWDNGGTNQSMTAVPGSPAVNGNESVYGFYLLNPTAGNKQLVMSWTGGGNADTQICSWQNASGVANFNSANGGAPQTVAITAGANDMVHGGFSSSVNHTSTGVTQIDIDITGSQWSVAWQRATGPNPTLQANPGGATSLSAGFSITATGGGGPTCNGGLMLRGAGGC